MGDSDDLDSFAFRNLEEFKNREDARSEEGDGIEQQQSLFLMSPQEVSSLEYSSAQSVTKGAKGQLIKSRIKDKPTESDKRCLDTFYTKVGGKAAQILREFSQYNNKKDQALADMVLRNAVNDYRITKKVAFSVFGIGNPRWKRVMNNLLVKAKEDITYVNVKAITEDDLNAFKEFVQSLPKEPGYPCNHRRQKL